MLAHAASQDVDDYLIAGDLVGGPEGDAVVERLEPYRHNTITGNNEEYLIDFHHDAVTAAQRESQQWAFSRACHARSEGKVLDTLAALPPRVTCQAEGSTAVCMVHGSTRSSSEPLGPELDTGRLEQVLEEISESVLICGHTHQSWTFRGDAGLALNPGSVGGACNDDNRAQYAILQWEDGNWHVEHHAVAYDLTLVTRLYVDTGFVEEAGPMARAQLEGIHYADLTMGDLVHHARNLAAAAGKEASPIVADDIWEQAVDTFSWKMPPPV